MNKVSVIIPTYKRSQYLTRAVESVLNQSYSNFEVLVVDDNGDGAPDRPETERRIAPYLGERVKYIQNPVNLGGALARNVGIEHATGDYITFLDDDDIYLPDKLRVQCAEMDLRGWDLSFMDADLHDEQDRPVQHLTHDLPAQPDQSALMVAHLIEHLTPTATFMFRAEVLRRIGGFEKSHTAHEYLLMLKAIDQKLFIGYIHASHLIQYIHPGERISMNAKKVEGENYLFSVKRRYFSYLTRAQRRQVRVRHFATLFFVYFKRRQYGSALVAGARAVIASPPAAIQLIRSRGAMMSVSTPDQRPKQSP